MTKFLYSLAFMLLFGGILYAQTDYSNNQRLAQRVNSLSKNYAQYVKTQSLAKTLGGADIWLIIIGTGATDQKPAVAVVGGVDGKHLLGVELAMGFAEKLLANAQQDSIRQLLENQTFYVFPNVSPDATAQYFASVQYERSGNARPVDYDRDGKIAEDGYDDLDGDGKITYIRITDPTGDHLPNPSEPRSMIKADPAKGQVGRYIVHSEGIDNDKDGLFNEDGEEGIHFNKNATYNYKNFQPGAGDYAVSEIENRALFDFLYDAFNVFAVVSFGPQNNLSTPVQPAQGGRGGAAPATTPGPGQGFRMTGGGKITDWSQQDAKVSAFVSEQYNKITGTKDAPKTTAGNGDFVEWAYYHYGRYSFGTPGWWVPKPKPDTTGRQGGPGGSASRGAAASPGSGAGSDDPVANYLKWAAAEGITNTFQEWTPVDHPDFPGKTVEVGGLHPFVLHNPPYHLVDDIASKHTDFVVALAHMAPKVDIINVKTEKIDNGLTRVTLDVFNEGLLPNITTVGERSYFLKRIAVHVKTSGNQSVVSGRKSQTLNAIPGRGNSSLTWLIQGTGQVSIEAGSLTTGTKIINVSL